MLTIKTPQKYINESGILSKAGELIGRYGKKLYILTGKTAWEKTGDNLAASFEQAGLSYTVSFLEGYPTRENFEKHAKEATDFGADLFVAVGGGKICDSGKSASKLAGLPIVTIPTIAATCASWAALTIVYNDAGRVVGCDFHENCPVLVIADTQVILDAPERYLKAGIIDTLAKWYEFAPSLDVIRDDITLDITTGIAKEAYDILIGDLDQTIEDIKAHRVTPNTTRAVDAVIYLAGLSGGLTSENTYGGFAHGYYNSITQLPETRHMLHGERVALGLITQFVVEDRPVDEIDTEIQYFLKLDQPVTLQQIGVTDPETAALTIAPDIRNFVSFVPFLKGNKNLESLSEFILKADELGKKYL